MVAVFREVRRVLRDDGVVWLNLGDSYTSGGRDRYAVGKEIANSRIQRSSGAWNALDDGDGSFRPATPPGLKPKDLCGIPWRLAFALQADGWYLRSDIVWSKPNPMPESVTDRPTRSHEYIFLLTKSARYFYDSDAIREQSVDPESLNGRNPRNHDAATQSDPDGKFRYRKGFAAIEPGTIYAKRNKRSVWTINSEPTPEAHFATFPQKLVEPCILAGTSEKGCCAECGAPRVRMSEGKSVSRHELPRDDPNYRPARYTRKSGSDEYANGGGQRFHITTGESWYPSCHCQAPSVPCLVLDPFAGSGTVLKVAERFGRRSVGLELSADYISIAKRRTAQLGLQL